MAHSPILDSNGFPECCARPKNHPEHTRAQVHQATQDAATAPLTPPRHLSVVHSPHAPDTSQAAAQVAWPRAGSKRAEVLEAVAAAGEYGATDDDLVFDTDLPANTVRPRRGELVTGGCITQARNPDGSGRTRPSDQGNDARVWVLTDAARDRLATV